MNERKIEYKEIETKEIDGVKYYRTKGTTLWIKEEA